MRFRSFFATICSSILGILLLAPAGAEAQTPYSISIRSQAYQPLPIAGGTANVHPATGTGTGDEWVHPFQLPFAIRFFDEEKTSASISSNGWISFIQTTTASHSNAVIPATAAPNDLIAPFWDDLGCSSLKTQVLGTAPARTVVIEWPCYRWNTPASTAEMQVWLFEGSSTIEIHYGQIQSGSWNASMGIENATGTVGYWIRSRTTGQDCGNSCTPTDWHDNSVVTFSQGPELRVSGVRGAPEGFAGIPMDVSATIMNVGGKPANDFTVRFWVSPEPRVTEDSLELLTLEGDVRSLDPQGVTTYEASPRLPTALDAGSFYIIAEADPFLRVPESNRGDNYGVFGPFEVGLRAPNLRAFAVDLDDEVAPLGGFTGLEWTLDNTGNLSARDIPYAVVLSSSSNVGVSARELARGTVDRLDSLETKRIRVDQIPLPSDLMPGVYHLAVVADPERVIFEHDRSDNIGVSMPIFLHGEELEVVTQSLPAASLEGAYSVRLLAAGGDGIYRWSVQEGSTLPPGLSLVEETPSDGRAATFLRGYPAASGVFSFVLSLRSGDETLDHTFHLEVTAPGMNLRVLNDVLASAAFGVRYEEHLAAHGGHAPYTWSITRGSLPKGILLRSDGFLSGVPRQDGSFEVTVQVMDDAGSISTRAFTMVVSSPSALTCVTQELPTLELGQTVYEPLVAAGGNRQGNTSYQWEGVSVARLADEIGEYVGVIDKATAPPGLDLDTGVVRGKPTEFGTYAWAVRVRVPGDSPVDCRVIVRVPRDHGLTVATKILPVARAGSSYRAELSAMGGSGSYQWGELEPGRVLHDLGLSFQGGALVGTPSLDHLGGEQAKEFSFMVRVRDEANRIGIGALTLRLEAERPKPAKQAKKDEGGCQAGAGGVAWTGLALVGLALLRRRR